MQPIRKLMLRGATALVLVAAVQAGSAAVPPNFPQTFPAAMAFGAITHATRRDDKALAELAPYDWIHVGGTEGFGARAREKYPDKLITIQRAYGGIGDELFTQVWPGHLLYRVGTPLTADLSSGDTQLSVADEQRLVHSQRALDRTSDRFPMGLLIYAVDDKGRPDFSHAEHVVLERVKRKYITVRRAQWGSHAQSFRAGHAMVAAHMMFWRRQWQLNLSLDCPRGGPDQITAAEWYARVLEKKVRDEHADGVEMDVGRWTWGNPEGASMDADNDGVADYGYLDGVNSFGLGGQVLFRELRKRLGDGKLIQVDSNDAVHGIRGWRYLNGVQMESFPAANDFDRFSQAFQHFRLWTENAEALPRESYPFTKTPTTTYAKVHMPDGSSADFRFRVGLAAALMQGMAHPFASLSTIKFDPGEDVNEEKEAKLGIFQWDEYHGGDLNDWHWLGRPLGPARQDLGGMRDKDLLAGVSLAWSVDGGFDARTSTSGGALTATVNRIPAGVIPRNNWYGVRLEPRGKQPPGLVPGAEYTLEFEARGDDRWSYRGQTFDRVPRALMIRVPMRSNNDLPLSALVDDSWRHYRLSFVARGDGGGFPVFGVSEQVGGTQLRNVHLYEGGAERWSREFEKGVVLMNMTQQPWNAPLPGAAYRRLKGRQAADVNNGASASGSVTVPARDALYLVKR